MRKLKALVVLAVLAGLAVWGALKTQSNPEVAGVANDAYLPTLAGQLENITEIVATGADGPVTLTIKDGQWVVANRSGYPAQPEEVRQVLLGAAQLRRVEPKTSKAENYTQIELGNPGEPGTQSVGYEFKGGTDAIASVIIGKRRVLSAATDADQYFVRTPGDPQTWLVEGKIPKHKVASDWLAREVIKVDRERVHRVTVRHPDGDTVSIVKGTMDAAGYQLLGVPEGSKVEHDFGVDSIATTATDLTLNDVRPASKFTFDPVELSVVFETFDGMQVTIEVAKKDDSQFIRLQAAEALELRSLLATEGTEGLKDAAAVSAEVKALNARWQPWVYQIPSYHVETFRKKVSDLVESTAVKEKKPG